MLIAMVLFVPASMTAQTRDASATLRASVSETVTLSVSPNSIDSSIHADGLSTGGTVRLTLSGTDASAPVIRVPLIVRSNSRFRISAAVESTTAELSQLSVIDVRATGALVSPAAISEIEVPQQLDRRGLDESASAAMTSDLLRPFLVLSGPRVSLGGTLESPNNAVQITVLIRLKPQPAQSWLAHLTFSGTPVSIF
jgi:hypothetical protein